MKFWFMIVLKSISVKSIESLVPWILLLILCTRTLAVCYFCSKINDESSRTTKILHEVSTGSNLSDLKAFQNFLMSTTIALNGMGLFWMTKQIILTVIYFNLVIFWVRIYWIIYEINLLGFSDEIVVHFGILQLWFGLIQGWNIRRENIEEV